LGKLGQNRHSTALAGQDKSGREEGRSMPKQERFEKIHELQDELRNLRYEYWRDDVLYSYQWFLLLVGMVGILLLWFRYVNRSRLAGILICGLITLEITTSLDVLGAEMQAWDYPSMLLPWGARLFCVDFMISIIIMFLYQWFVSWRIYMLAAAVMSLLFAFVLEPVCI
jgi:hypothetical protein